MAEMMVYGVKIVTDDRCPMNSWYPETKEMRELANLILDMDKFLRTHNMKMIGMVVR